MVGEAKQAEDRVPTLGASAGAGAVGAESMGPGQGGGAELWGPPPEFQALPAGPRGPSGATPPPAPPEQTLHPPRLGSLQRRPVLGAWRYLLRQLPPPSSNLSSESRRLLIRQQDL